MSINRFGVGFLLAAALGLSAAATAAPSRSGWYLAIDGGQARYNGIVGNAQQWVSIAPTEPPNSGMVIATLPQSSLQRSESSSTGYRLTVGYQFDRYLAMEGSYVNFGSIHAGGEGAVGTAAANGLLPLEGIATFSDAAKLRAWGWELAAIGNLPLNQRWSLFGRVGMFDSHTRLDIVSTPASPSPAGLIATSVSESSSSWEPTFGVGVSFSPVDHWAVRLDWDRYAHMGDRDTIMGRSNVNLVSLGFVYTL